MEKSITSPHSNKTFETAVASHLKSNNRSRFCTLKGKMYSYLDIISFSLCFSFDPYYVAIVLFVDNTIRHNTLNKELINLCFHKEILRIKDLNSLQRGTNIKLRKCYFESQSLQIYL